MPMLQIDGIDIAEINQAVASTLVHLKLRTGLGHAGGLPELKSEPARREVTSHGVTWASVAQVAETKAVLTLRFQDVGEREVHRLALD